MEEHAGELKYFIYVRKSSEDEGKQVQSHDDQIRELERVQQHLGLEVARIFRESRSAKAPGRPVFNDMLDRIHKGEANAILCWKLDRLARNPIDGGTISWMLQQGIIQQIQTYDRAYQPGDNVIIMSVEFGQANQMIRDMVPAVRRGMQGKRLKGHYPHVAPPGYLNDRMKPKGERDVIEDPDRFDMLQKMFFLVTSEANTPMEVLRMANNDWGFTTYPRRKTGGGPLSSSTWYRILSNPFYYGYWEEKGVTYKGSHKPMITEEQYWNIQRILGKKGRKRPRVKNFSYTGMIKCGECGYFVTAEEKRKINKKTGKPFVYYRCGKKNPQIHCTQRCAEVFVLEEDVDEFLVSATLNEKVNRWCKRYLQHVNKEEVTISSQALASFHKQKEEIQRKMHNLTTVLVDGRITGEEYDERKIELMKEQDAVDFQLKQVDMRTLNWLENCEKTFNFFTNARYWFNYGSIEQKKQILKFIGSNFILTDRKLDFEPAKYTQEVQKGVKTNDWRPRRESNPQPSP